MRIALPFTVLTLGLGALVLNGLVVAGAAAIEPGVTLDRVFDGVLVAIGLTAVNTIFTTLFAIDDEDFWYSHAVRRQARRAGVQETDVPGVYFLEIDGLAHEVLRRAIRDGNAPNLAQVGARPFAPAAALGDGLVVANGRLPGRAPARQQRRHARLPLVGEGQRTGDSHEPPA